MPQILEKSKRYDFHFSIRDYAFSIIVGSLFSVKQIQADAVNLSKND